MSSFDGRVSEYPWIAIDCFLKQNFTAHFYFLSHLHQDHMKGLDSPAFRTHLNGRPKSRIYCSEITKSILIKDANYSHLKLFLQSVPTNDKIFIELQQTFDTSYTEIETVAVTFLPSGHCPGSMMFLLEGKHGNILYTGDFRMEGDEHKFMVYNYLSAITIDSVYLDTTFCLPEMMTIPKRKTITKQIINKIQQWLCQGTNHVVCLRCRARLGYEYLLSEIAKKLKTKILVHSDQIKLYDNIPEVRSNLTLVDKETKIHMCIRGRCRLLSGPPTPDSKKLKILRIKPCALSFAYNMEALKQGCFTRGANFYSFLYSAHSSMAEIIEFLKCLRPLKVYPNVVPVKDSDLDAVTQRINGIMGNCDIPRKKTKMTASCSNPGKDQGKEILPLEPIANTDLDYKASRKKSAIMQLNDKNLMLDDVDPCQRFICRRRSRDIQNNSS
ncbi:Protein artemis [Trichoplax sp. H2]|uniref:Protein artemis n=1 Tax=Trichoplax adhaerens TaxID=10228 RepID=B3RMC7_TRIAD|nr:hypothetical protein TRIADDRAFT_53902 [Trichoplax adhaerens]EDV27826.1 hypothetical protein TRIADDRAFT_53902 [Trichoplax adhaerens]RDD45644.1 Protein artemis [Trichoplax sp. H2]|eukprot:XP_002109660.1 hypothetical protein TRIADDRAFT_53902 [Trichoplax adhaerens]